MASKIGLEMGKPVDVPPPKAKSSKKPVKKPVKTAPVKSAKMGEYPNPVEIQAIEARATKAPVKKITPLPTPAKVAPQATPQAVIKVASKSAKNISVKKSIASVKPKR